MAQPAKHKYRLVYFNEKARAEVIRMMFAVANQPYEDARVSWDDWEKVKPTLPSGQLPYLEVDGKRYFQSMAITRYLAAEFGLYGKTNEEKLQINVVLETVLEMFEKFATAVNSHNEGCTEALWQRTRDQCKISMILLSDWLGKSDCLVGKTLTVADLMVAHYVQLFETHKCLEKIPANIAKLQQRVFKVPAIAGWIAKRPESTF